MLCEAFQAAAVTSLWVCLHLDNRATSINICEMSRTIIIIYNKYCITERFPHMEMAISDSVYMPWSYSRAEKHLCMKPA